MSLVARCLEEAGIPTIICGSARDIVEECGVPRFLFTDFPLGNPCGRPGDYVMQEQIVTQALGLLTAAFAPRTTLQSSHRWPDDTWRSTYMQIKSATPKGAET